LDVSVAAVGPADGDRTTWAHTAETPLRRFLRTETGGAAVVLASAIAALVWANVDAHSYERVWDATLSVRIGGVGPVHDLRYWVNSGLMTLFFFVAGLEVRREFDMGELRDRRRVALPVIVGVGGILIPIAGYVALNVGRSSLHGWAITMSTDTALALGMLALVGRGTPDRLRAFLLTVSIVDDVAALIVISIVYSNGVKIAPLLVSLAVFAVIVALVAAGVSRGLIYAALGVGAWLALSASRIDPIVIGIAMGLLTSASPAARGDLERASDLFRRFREQPTSELQRSARLGLESAVSPNERLQMQFHPWASYFVVPLFALANAGIVVRGSFLAHALSSPITLGILVGSVLGKPVGVILSTGIATTVSRGRIRSPVGWAALASGGTIAGIGFTVSLLIANLAFRGQQLEEAKLGVLMASVLAPLVTFLVLRLTYLLPTARRTRALQGTSQLIIDLAVPPDPRRDHIRGPEESPVTIVEYADFECPYCGRAEPILRTLLSDYGDIRYVWRHLPLTDVHPHAQLASEASEAAAEQGAFWQMHDRLLEHQSELSFDDLLTHARTLGLDVDRFAAALENDAGAARIAEDVDGADLSGVTGTPTFFINGLRHFGTFDIDALVSAVRTARERAIIHDG
jgi:Na+/H+ antiporter NhaA